MTHAYRAQEILSRARRDGKVLAEQVAQELEVTVQTVRRDLNRLCDQGILARIHGGAVLPSGTENLAYTDRRALREGAKSRIGAATAAQIPNGASVFLDIGTTVEAVAENMLRHTGLLVVTNNINVANILSANQDADILLAGGLLRRSDGGLVGEITAQFARQFKVDIAVIGTSAIDLAGDALDFDFREVRVAQIVKAGARRSFLVADQSKLARSAPVRVAPVAEFDAWITDQSPPDVLGKLCKERSCEVIVAA